MSNLFKQFSNLQFKSFILAINICLAPGLTLASLSLNTDETNNQKRFAMACTTIKQVYEQYQCTYKYIDPLNVNNPIVAADNLGDINEKFVTLNSFKFDNKEVLPEIIGKQPPVHVIIKNFGTMASVKIHIESLGKNLKKVIEIIYETTPGLEVYLKKGPPAINADPEYWQEEINSNGAQVRRVLAIKPESLFKGLQSGVVSIHRHLRNARVLIDEAEEFRAIQLGDSDSGLNDNGANANHIFSEKHQQNKEVDQALKSALVLDPLLMQQPFNIQEVPTLKNGQRAAAVKGIDQKLSNLNRRNKSPDDSPKAPQDVKNQVSDAVQVNNEKAPVDQEQAPEVPLVKKDKLDSVAPPQTATPHNSPQGAVDSENKTKELAPQGGQDSNASQIPTQNAIPEALKETPQETPEALTQASTQGSVQGSVQGPVQESAQEPQVASQETQPSTSPQTVQDSSGSAANQSTQGKPLEEGKATSEVTSGQDKQPAAENESK